MEDTKIKIPVNRVAECAVIEAKFNRIMEDLKVYKNSPFYNNMCLSMERVFTLYKQILMDVRE